jgi:hypothetical protein
MKKQILILTLIFTLVGCSINDDSYITLKGRVEREINGEGISNQKVLLEIHQIHGTGNWQYTTKVDSKEVTTDMNGDFITSMKNDSKTFVYVYKPQDDNYSAFELTEFAINEEIILKVNKFLKFKIYVNNTNPFDSNDYIYIDFASGLYQSFRTNIENFGIQHTHYTSWKGTNVNSIVYYNVPENAESHKIFWRKIKNSIETNGVTLEIPFQENQVNEFHFDY